MMLGPKGILPLMFTDFSALFVFEILKTFEIYPNWVDSLCFYGSQRQALHGLVTLVLSYDNNGIKGDFL